MTVLDERFDLEALRGAPRYQQWLLSMFPGAFTGEVLEVGPGVGNFTRWLAASARLVVAVEPEPTMANDVAGLGFDNVKVITTTLEELTGHDEQFDCVFLCNVLEHIDDAGAALRAGRPLLRPGGHLCVVVPAHRALFGTLDRRYGHLRRYRRVEVDRLLTEAGFASAGARYVNPIGAIGWFAVCRVLRAGHLSPASVRLSERVAVPLGKAIDRLGRAPFGQSVVVHARRPA